MGCQLAGTVVPAPPANRPVVNYKKEGGYSQKLTLFYRGNQSLHLMDHILSVRSFS